MHQIHLLGFRCTFHRNTSVCGYITVCYTSFSKYDFVEQYLIDVTDSSLAGWDTNEIDENMLAPFIPRYAIFSRKENVRQLRIV